MSAPTDAIEICGYSQVYALRNLCMPLQAIKNSTCDAILSKCGRRSRRWSTRQLKVSALNDIDLITSSMLFMVAGRTFLSSLGNGPINKRNKSYNKQHCTSIACTKFPRWTKGISDGHLSWSSTQRWTIDFYINFYRLKSFGVPSAIRSICSCGM